MKYYSLDLFRSTPIALNVYMYSAKCIMLADDDSDDRFLFEEALREVCNVSKLIVACDGLELIKKLEETVKPFPDVIFIDINMPYLNGLECLSKIRLDKNLQSIPVIMLSTTQNKATVESAYKLGANYYIHKPSSFAVLKKMIEKVYTVLSSPLPLLTPKKDFLLTL